MWRERISAYVGRQTLAFSWKKLLFILLGAAICSFGIHNIHQRTMITEGGIIGAMLLIDHWFHFSPAYITPVLDAVCYWMAYRSLGMRFIRISIVSTISVSLFYKIWECFPPMLPDLSAYPLLAAILGGIFVGIGIGMIIRQGGSGGGDDALALVIAHTMHWRLSRCYLFTDVTVLLLSVSYLSLERILYSLVTVSISSYLIDYVQSFSLNRSISIQYLKKTRETMRKNL